MSTAVEQHAAQARLGARARGLADCIHYAPRWMARVDALYAQADASGLEWCKTGFPGLLSDGRMVVTSDVASFFEVKS